MRSSLGDWRGPPAAFALYLFSLKELETCALSKQPLRGIAPSLMSICKRVFINKP